MIQDEEKDWQEVWVELDSELDAVRMVKRCSWVRMDKRSPSIPKKIDYIWEFIEQFDVAFFAIPWLIVFFIATPSSMEGVDVWSLLWVRSWGAFFIKAVAFSTLFYGAIYCVWSASKTSWNARWAGPNECLEVQNLSNQSSKADKWMKRAQKSGIRCVDLEMMSWISRRQYRVRNNLRNKEEAANRILNAQAAFNEMNAGQFQAMSECDEMNKTTAQAPLVVSASKPRRL